MKKSKRVFIASAVCGMISLAAQAADKAKPADAPKPVKGECHGVNSCKGTSDCHTATNSCAGANSCKGKGWKSMTEDECKAAKGQFKKG